jgi:chromate reductase
VNAATTNVLGIVGSLRKASLHRHLLNAAKDLAPSGMTIDSAELEAIPLYNADVQAEGFPSPVQDLGARIAAADAVLIASPEYNYSVPGVLKNALDWVSRLPDQPFADKPVAIMGGSPGPMGGSRMQYHLRQVFLFLDARVLTKPEVMIPMLAQKFDDNGKITDETTAGFVTGQLEALAAWTHRLKG